MKSKPQDAETSESDEDDHHHMVALHATRSRAAADEMPGPRSWGSSQTQTGRSSAEQRNGTTVEEANAAHQADLEKGLGQNDIAVTNGNGNVERKTE